MNAEKIEHGPCDSGRKRFDAAKFPGAFPAISANLHTPPRRLRSDIHMAMRAEHLLGDTLRAAHSAGAKAEANAIRKAAA